MESSSTSVIGTTTTTTTIASSSTNSSTNNNNNNKYYIILLLLFVISFITFIRVLIGIQSHSGQNNYHGSKVAYGGDYEAQRHWMEITIHLPISQWYYYDLQYWGIDYPPLTTYISYIFGILSHYIIGPESMELYTSRGYENPIHKSYMRITVIITDLLLYGTAVWYWLYRKHNNITNNNNNNNKQLIQLCFEYIITMIQPSILLIDHGHFQYNTTALGLTLWSLYYLTNNDNNIYVWDIKNYIIASILFVFALSFKQMTLYYSTTIFFYLLGKCFYNNNYYNNNNNTNIITWKIIFQRICILGITVIITFIILWYPFIIYGPDNTTYIERFIHIIHRIFPLQRGLYENKVSNIWFVLSIKPIRIRDHIPKILQPIAALLLTLLLLIPCSIPVFLINECNSYNNSNNTISNNTTENIDSDNNDDNIDNYSERTTITNNQQSSKQQQKSQLQQQLQQQQLKHLQKQRDVLLWGTTCSSLAFFLASYQVHEKSILMALAPCSLLSSTDRTFVQWFSIICVWTLYPLMQIDQLQIAYICIICIYLSIIGLQNEWFHNNNSNKRSTFNNGNKVSSIIFEINNVNNNNKHIVCGFFESSKLIGYIPKITYYIMITLHILEILIPPPKSLPDIFPVLWSITGCTFFCIAYIATCWHMFQHLIYNNNNYIKYKDE